MHFLVNTYPEAFFLFVYYLDVIILLSRSHDSIEIEFKRVKTPKFGTGDQGTGSYSETEACPVSLFDHFISF